MHQYGSPCWVSAAKSCRWQVFANGVAPSARIGTKLCFVNKATRDGDWREAEPSDILGFASRKAPWGFHLFLPFGRSSLKLRLKLNKEKSQNQKHRDCGAFGFLFGGQNGFTSSAHQSLYFFNIERSKSSKYSASLSIASSLGFSIKSRYT